MLALVGVLGLAVAGCGDAAGDDGSTERSGSTGAGSPDRSGDPATVVEPEQLTVKVLETRPHNPESFTQGFEIAGDVLYEGTGLVGQSAIMATDPVTGDELRRVDLPAELFGEGITVVGDRIWQLTWTDGIAFERSIDDLGELRRVEYSGEGWGLCHDGERLVMSDGSDWLTFRDPDSFDVLGEIQVRRNGEPASQLNELECVAGAVYANVWYSDDILRIDPSDGSVTAVVDASALRAEVGPDVDVLNGIAAIPDTDEFLLTGKHWPSTFRVSFIPA